VDPAPYAGAITAALWLAGGSIVLFFLVRIYTAGKQSERVDTLKDRLEGDDDFQKSGEDWDSADPLDDGVSKPDR